MNSTPTVARTYGGARLWHDLVPGATRPRTMCGRDARAMARFSPADLPSGERDHRQCEACRKARQEAGR